MHTAVIDKSTGRIAFSQSGKANHEAMAQDARSSGIASFEIVELDDAAHEQKLVSLRPVVVPTKTWQEALQEVVDALPQDIRDRIGRPDPVRGPNR
jgi:hypothetical protein